MDRVVDKRGTRDAAKAYLDFLYSPAGQEVLVKHFNRVRDPGVAKKHEALFKPVRLVTIEDVFGSWQEIQKVHFGEGGTLGPELNYPASVTEYVEPTWLRRWIDAPLTVRHGTPMPGLPPGIPDREAALRDVIAYLTVMAGHKLAPAEPPAPPVPGAH